jgi:hypothetical protein
VQQIEPPPLRGERPARDRAGQAGEEVRLVELAREQGGEPTPAIEQRRCEHRQARRRFEEELRAPLCPPAAFGEDREGLLHRLGEIRGGDPSELGDRPARQRDGQRRCAGRGLRHERHERVDGGVVQARDPLGVALGPRRGRIGRGGGEPLADREPARERRGRERRQLRGAPAQDQCGRSRVRGEAIGRPVNRRSRRRHRRSPAGSPGRR